MKSLATRFSLALLLVTIGMVSALAQDTIPPVTVTGFVDTYFSFNFARPASHTNLYRNFDITENSFVLSEAEVSVSRAAAPVGFHIDANYGAAMDAIYGAPNSTTNIVQQAYLTAVFPVGGKSLTVDAGKFVTHMGFEVIKAKDNFNYSRSISFAWSIPYYHYGARVSYPLSEQLTATAHLLNGWNGTEVNSSKTFGLTLAYNPLSTVSVIGNWIGGQELPDSVNKTWRNVGELIVSVAATEKLTLALDGTYGTEPIQGVTTEWKGLAVYGKYAINDIHALTLRGELYNDSQGYTTGAAQTLGEATLTYEIKPLTNLILRAEYRYDWSDVPVFEKDTTPGAQKYQQTALIGAIVVF